MGWKILGNYPHEVKKKLIIAAPHTSNWDFPLAMLVKFGLKMKVKFIGKASLFNPPLGWIMYPLGGIPVNMNPNESLVEARARTFNEADELTIGMSPEGQRVKIDNFKTGFYHIARMAKIPLVPVILNWAEKKIQFLDLIHIDDDDADQITKIENIFRGYIGFYAKHSF